MKKLLTLSLLLLTLCPILKSQNVAAWEDRQGRLQYYDNGFVTQLDHQRADRSNRFLVGGDFIIFHNNRDEIVYYRKGHEENLHLRDVLEEYTVTQHLVTLEVGDVFEVIDHKKKTMLSLQKETPFVYGDSIIAYVDLYGQLKAFFRGEIHEVNPHPPVSFKASDNSFAWTNFGFQFYENEETHLISEEIPNDYKVGGDFVLYLSDYDEFMIWRDGENVSLHDYPPNSWKVGDNIAAYVDDDDNFMLIDKNSTEPIELAPAAPEFYDIVDNTLVYIDNANYLNIYYEGENHLLEYYRPEEFQYYDGIVAYTDDNGRLKAFYEGKTLPVSENIITSFKVQGRVILYEIGNRDYQIFHNGLNFYR